MDSFQEWLKKLKEDAGAGAAPAAPAGPAPTATAASSATKTSDVAKVPMRLLADRGKGYFGVPGRPSPYDKKKRPTVITREFPKVD